MSIVTALKEREALIVRELEAIRALLRLYEGMSALPKPYVDQVLMFANPKPDNQPQAEETAAAPIPEVVGATEPEPDAGASGPAPAVGEHRGRPKKPKTEDELIAEHLATKGVITASEEQPTGQQVLDEARRDGLKIVANKELSLFRVGNGGARTWRDGLLTIANRKRIARGEKPWATTRVRWPNDNGSVPGPIVKESA